MSQPAFLPHCLRPAASTSVRASRSDDVSTIGSEELEDRDEGDLESEDSQVEAEVEGPERGMLVFNYHQWAESKPELEGDLLKEEDQDRPIYPGPQGHIRDPKDCITATVAVHNIGSGQAVRMFHIAFVRPPTSSSHAATLPQLSAMLPLSASGSQAHYLPSVVGPGIVAGRGTGH